MARSYNNLAGLYQVQGDYVQALPLHQKALSIREKTLGKEHPDTANSYNNMALLQLSLKNCHHAKYYAEKALVVLQHYNFQEKIVDVKAMLKSINWNIKKANKLPPKRRAKFCKDWKDF